MPTATIPRVYKIVVHGSPAKLLFELLLTSSMFVAEEVSVFCFGRDHAYKFTCTIHVHVYIREKLSREKTFADQ